MRIMLRSVAGADLANGSNPPRSTMYLDVSMGQHLIRAVERALDHLVELMTFLVLPFVNSGTGL